MKWYLCRSIVLAATCLAAAPNAQQAGVKSAEAFIHEWVSSFNDNDPGKLLSFYDRARETQVIVSAGLSYRGLEAIGKAYADGWKGVRFSDSTAKKMDTRLLGETAVVSFEHRFKVRVLEDGSRWQVHVRTSSVLHRINRRWAVVFEHSSPIHGVERMVPLDE